MDPSGFTHVKKSNSGKMVLRVVVAVVVAYFTGTYVDAYAGMVASEAGASVATATAVGTVAGGAAGGFVAGGIMGGDLQSALQGALSGALFAGADVFSAYAGFGTTGQMLTRSVASGLSSEMQGGKFGDGFKNTLGIEVLSWAALEMREATIQQSCQGGTSNPNCSGQSAGFGGGMGGKQEAHVG